MPSYLSRGRSTCKVMASFYSSGFNKSDEQMTVIQASLSSREAYSRSYERDRFDLTHGINCIHLLRR